jgi:hypothetical protein
MAKEATVTFKMSDEMSDWFSKCCFRMEKSKSEVLRACILLGIDTIIASPCIVNLLQFEDRKQ